MQIAHELGVHRQTVMKYEKMALEEFQASQTYERDFKHKLDIYEEEVKNELSRKPYLSCRQVHDHLRENHSDFPNVNGKTVFNFVMHIRNKYGIAKGFEETFRPLEKLPESAPGRSMQADFGEYWMHRNDTRRVKVYFFVAVMSHSRHKFTYFSKTPFTSELTIYAHQLAFQFYGGKPQEVIYDQDKVLIHSENLGDVVLTKAFQAFVSSEHFKCVFCRKSDPQSKGKVENVVKYISSTGSFVAANSPTSRCLMSPLSVGLQERQTASLTVPQNESQRKPSRKSSRILLHIQVRLRILRTG